MNRRRLLLPPPLLAPARVGRARALSIVLIVMAGCSAANRDAISVIERHGAAVTKPIGGVTVFVVRDSNNRQKLFTDTDLKAIVPALGKLQDFTALDLSESSITDASIEDILRVPGLTVLNVEDTALTAAALQRLATKQGLKTIVVRRGQFGDGDMAKLRSELAPVKLDEFGRPAS